MKKIHAMLLPAAALGCLVPMSASASLIGSTVTGSLTFTGDPSNYFDPGNGFVPTAGYLNANGTTVHVSRRGVEFGFDDGSTAISTDITADQITIEESIEQSGQSNGSKLIFTDSAFVGLPLTFASGNMVPIDFSIAGNSVILDFPGANVTAGQTFTSTFGLSPVPEPSTFTLTLTSALASFAVFVLRGLRSTA